MLKFKFIVAGLICCFLGAGCRTSLDELLSKMDNATDPSNKLRTVKTKLVKAEMTIPAQKLKMQMTVINKYPNKTKTIVNIPGVMNSVQGYNGKDAWEFTKGMGVRKASGAELNFIKFQTQLDNPNSKLKDVFAKIELDEDGESVSGYACYKLTCYPPEACKLSPFILYVDKSSYYTRKISMTAVTGLGSVPSMLELSDFKAIQGIITPLHMKIKQMGMNIMVKIISVEYGAEVSDSTFDIPGVNKKGK